MPAFARDPATRAYYEARAAEYDDWWRGTGRFADRQRPGWHQEAAELVEEVVAGLPAAKTLDIACGTGYLTQHLRGTVFAVDQSRASVEIAQSRLPDGIALVGDALALPVADGAFDRAFTAHFYGHLPPEERTAFLTEARRVARELVVVDSALRDGVPEERTETRVLDDGSEHAVYKRFLTADGLAREIGGEVLYAGRWFVAARASL